MMKKLFANRKIKEEDKKEKKKEREVGLFREYFELISETLIYVFFVMTFLLQSFVIPTGSMKDNILIGDHILVNKVSYSKSLGFLDGFMFPRETIKRGMIVTFKSPAEMEKEYVKRVIGLPGESIKIVNKEVFINGEPLKESYTVFKDSNLERSYRDNFPEFKIPDNHYFCMGDNRDHSYDSRFWGPVPADYIIGKPWRVYWSYESTTDEYLTPGFWHKVKDIFNTFINFFTKTRWNRTIMKIE
ncbi:MAG: signal peptidase I [bacterium]|nr:signal peptidase I [bacterium]